MTTTITVSREHKGSFDILKIGEQEKQKRRISDAEFFGLIVDEKVKKND